MSSMSILKVITTLNDLKIKVVTPLSLSKILDINNENTIYKIIERLEKNKLINRLIKGKYTVSNINISDFEKANLILSPSYISLESALTY